MIKFKYLLVALLALMAVACGGSHNDKLLKHKKWRLYTGAW